MVENISCGAEELSAILVDNIAKYTKEVREALYSGIDDIADETLGEVRELSPVYDGDYTPKPGGKKYAKYKSGAYKKRWTTTVKCENGRYTVTVHNMKYMLVHLLELGHLNRDGTTRSKPIPHVAIAEKNAEKKIDKLIGGL